MWRRLRGSPGRLHLPGAQRMGGAALTLETQQDIRKWGLDTGKGSLLRGSGSLEQVPEEVSMAPSLAELKKPWRTCVGGLVYGSAAGSHPHGSFPVWGIL